MNISIRDRLLRLLDEAEEYRKSVPQAAPTKGKSGSKPTAAQRIESAESIDSAFTIIEELFDESLDSSERIAAERAARRAAYSAAVNIDLTDARKERLYRYDDEGNIVTFVASITKNGDAVCTPLVLYKRLTAEQADKAAQLGRKVHSNPVSTNDTRAYARRVIGGAWAIAQDNVVGLCTAFKHMPYTVGVVDPHPLCQIAADAIDTFRVHN